MSKLTTGVELGMELIKALKLENHRVKDITIKVNSSNLATADITLYIEEDSVQGIFESLEKYRLERIKGDIL